jgi:2-methylcitrate dehydratase PrpD
VVRDHIESTAAAPRASMIGGGQISVDQAALFNSVAVRYVKDFHKDFHNLPTPFHGARVLPHHNPSHPPPRREDIWPP